MLEFSTAVGKDWFLHILPDRSTHESTLLHWKGRRDRVFAHVNAALKSDDASEKLDTIRGIMKQGLEVRYTILRHGLTEKEAYEIESALIDFVGLEQLTNLVAGHYSDDRGKMDVGDIIQKYDAPAVTIIEPSILITINRLFNKSMSAEDLYNVTRGNWVMGSRRNKALYAFAVYHGSIRGVYEINSWMSIKTDYKRANRWQFDGAIAWNLQRYVGGSTVNYPASQNPIRYINCDN